jgi:chaperone BCS1
LTELQPQRAGEPNLLRSSIIFAHYCCSLLFATTNHIERLDPALSRPGRMDVWVNFAYATKYQAEGIFKCFFPVESSTPEPEETSEISESQELKDLTQQNLPLPKKKINNCLISFSEVEITELAKRFGEAIPENELSVGRFGLILCLRHLMSCEY